MDITRKEQIVDAMSEKNGFTKKDNNAFYDSLVEVVKEGIEQLEADEVVTLPSLCKYTLKATKARTGHNPQNVDQEIDIPANFAVRCKTFPSITRSRRV